MDAKTHLTDVNTLRKHARQNIGNGAGTAGYSAERVAVLKILNEALATEVVCVLRYRRHYFMAKGIQSKSIADKLADLLLDLPKERKQSA